MRIFGNGLHVGESLGTSRRSVREYRVKTLWEGEGSKFGTTMKDCLLLIINGFFLFTMHRNLFILTAI